MVLANLLDYWRRPAQHLLRQYGLRLDALESGRLADSEPLDPQFARLDRVAQRLFFDAAAVGQVELPEAPPDWLRYGGLWPPVRAGERAWERQRAVVADLLADADGSGLFQAGALQRLPQAIDLGVAGWRVQGELTRAYRSGGTDWIFELPQRKESDLDFGARLVLFLEWALLQLAQWNDPRPLRVLLPGSGDKRPWQTSLDAWSETTRALQRDAPAYAARRAELERRVAALLQLYLGALREPLWYFPRTSWAAAAVDVNEARVLLAWHGNDRQTGERDYMPGYARLFASGAELAPGTPEFDELVATAQTLRTLIEFDAGAAA